MANACQQRGYEPAPSFDLREANRATRPLLERFIAQRFAEVYDARVYHFMPRLLGLHDVDGKLVAAFGLRAADQQTLFLERYLDAPIEAYVAAHHDTPVTRRRIVEIGNLAGASAGSVRKLIALLSTRLLADGFHWAAFTGSARLCNSFSRLGLPLDVIAPAPVDRLDADERQNWGRYYDQSPSVMLGDIRSGHRQLQAEMAAKGSADPLEPLADLGAP